MNRFLNYVLLFTATLFTNTPCFAAPPNFRYAVDSPFDVGLPGLFQSLKRLNTTASVLHVVAHPDDEDGALLAYCSRGLGVRTMLFSITRGEGGANLISSDFFDELGALRTLEHAKAANIYGNELFYSRATDYGYSKTLEEANRKWDNGKLILRDLTEVVRRERPTVILSRFRGDSRDGHGHHQMAGVVSRRVFAAAANPESFSDQIESGLFPWQVQKIYSNNIRPGWREEDKTLWTIGLPTGEYDTALGRSYAQIARYGLGFQRSQGISGHEGDAGERTSYYQLRGVADGLETPRRELSLFDGIDTTLPGLLRGISDDAKLTADFRRIAKHADDAQRLYFGIGEDDLSAMLTPLVRGLQTTGEVLRSIDDQTLRSNDRDFLRQHLQRKESEFADAIVRVLALDVQVWATSSTENGQRDELRFVTPNSEFATNVRVTNRYRGAELTVRRISVDAPQHWRVESQDAAKVLQYNGSSEWKLSTRLTDQAEPTVPYWTRHSIHDPFYKVRTDSQQQPMPTCGAHARADIIVPATKDSPPVELAIVKPILVRFRHPEYGNVRYPLIVVPKFSVRFESTHGVIPTSQKNYELAIVAKSDSPEPATTIVELSAPKDWKIEPATRVIDFSRAGEETRATFVLTPPTHETVARGGAISQTREPTQIRASIRSDDTDSYSSGYTTVSARDVGRMNVYHPAVHRVRLVDVSIAGKPNVGYIAGSGDKVAKSLKLLGIPVSILSAADVATGDLNRFDVIMVGVRAYAVREDIRTHNDRLLEFTKQGGTLIVQYQTPEFNQNFGPYPYQMGRRPEEVSEEDSQVTILAPDHRLFNFPNRITARDFDGWVEQRGSKFWTSWDERYTPLLECHDAKQSPQEGGMMIAAYGKGTYVYSAYAWYRQLPQAVPGAYRIVANMLSLNAEK